MANNVILRKLYENAVIELLPEPQSWQVMADKNFVPLLQASRQKPSLKPDLKIFIETKKSHIWYVIRKVLISNIYLSWAYWVSGELTKRHKPFPAQSKKRFSWPQNLPQLAAYFDSIVLPITAKTTKTSPRMMAALVDETAKVQRRRSVALWLFQWRVCFWFVVRHFENGMTWWRVNAWLILRMCSRFCALSTATTTGTSLNKRFNEQNNGSARAL